jgi:thymidylate kinase
MPRVIVLTGLDGSGKTTFSSRLAEDLTRRGARVRYLHQFSYTFPGVRELAAWAARTVWPRIQARLAREGTAARPARLPAGPGRDDGRPSTRSAVRRAASLGLAGMLLAVGFLRTWWRVLVSRPADVLVFDRYFYDELVRCEWKFGAPVSRWRWLSRTVPRPDVLIYLTAPPEQSWARKKRQDAALEAFYKKDVLYRSWMDYLGGSGLQLHRVDTAALSIDQAAEAIAVLAGFVS